MLKLKKVQILGFKSFCDRTEVQLAGQGIAAIVGPNGCGKSNISDAITWVLGEQSAKSLRGIKMEDVIFAGTRDRKPTGMAEVSLTLVDPEVYDANTLTEGESEVFTDGATVTSINASGDWDESALRANAAQETEEAVAEAQPGTTYETEARTNQPAGAARDLEDSGSSDPEYDDHDANGSTDSERAGGEAADSKQAASPQVVLKIRRRKFNRTPIRAGEITVTRRLFRSGDSEYLLNGKICRLRDIQDIFMGTGLGGESYAMIGQERIGQLLGAKPHDRRGIIEEAAGITRFKTKKRLAELRLESARQNLSRVNDIFEEVTRQMAILKRQAAKAERYGALREELRGKLRVVLASRLTQIDSEQAWAAAEIARLAAAIETQSAQMETLDAEHTAAVAHGYQLDEQFREAGARANSSAVELERIAARTSSNTDRIADLTQRMAAGTDDLAQARAQLQSLAGELEQHRSFLENATAESATAREVGNAQQAQAQEATRSVLAAEALAESQRRNTMQIIHRAAQANSEIAQAEAGLAGLDRENERLATESDAARAELESLGQQRGQVKLSFESVTEQLKRLEIEIVDLRHTLEAKRVAETQSRRRGDELRADMATLTGRSNSLEALIREHSYSTDTVRKIFRATAQQDHNGSSAPVGTLADFLEVDGQYESMVDEFLREELNYIVVKSWGAADQGMRLLQNDVAGRATFLVHPENAVPRDNATHPEDAPALPGGEHKYNALHASAEGAAQEAAGSAAHAYFAGMSSSTPADGVVPLKNCIRVLNGLGRSLEVILPKLREGFVAPDSATARELAMSYPQSFFLSPSGETFHNVTVTGGRLREQGPLALKRELGEVQTKIEAGAAQITQNELATAALTHEIAEHTTALDSKNHERRDAERESANSGAALRHMQAEVSRIEGRLQQWQLAASRNEDQRRQRQDLIARRRDEAATLDNERAALEVQEAELAATILSLRSGREELQAAASAAAAALAGLDERRRNASANFEQIHRLYHAQTQRITQIEGQLAAAAEEQRRREQETTELLLKHTELTEMRAQAIAEGETLSSEVSALRTALGEMNTRLRTLRHDVEELREQRAGLSARAAKLTSDLEHLQETCRNDLSLEADVLRQDTGIMRMEADALQAEDEAARALKQRLEAMGPVNMMALEEFHETSERHAFLETQRQDLLDSIENTQASIKEIDDISRVKFDEAYRIINENFSATFAKLFGGGQAFMRLTEADTGAGKSDLSGIDIIASPPGKKLQNVLLLSGGEKALTALSLLVGIFQFQPAPFCVLDEVDAPLDETNVGRFARVISEMAETTQFVVITHSKRTMEQADVMYGVTMQEPGVSKIVSVSLGGRSKGREARSAA